MKGLVQYLLRYGCQWRLGLCGLAIVFCCPVFAFAEPTVDNPVKILDGEVGPSTGTLLTASLESAGYKAQELVLRDLSKMIEGMAVLVFVCIVISALITISMLGHYQTAMWFLVGPALFWFVLKPESASPGVEWRFNPSVQTQHVVDLGLNSSASKVQVSWLFHKWNIVVSSVVDELSKVFLSQKGNETVQKFMTRQRILDALMSSEVEGPNLLSLVKFTQMECSQELTDARLVALGNRDPEFGQTPEFRTAKARYDQQYNKRFHSFRPGPWRQFAETTWKTDVYPAFFTADFGAVPGKPWETKAPTVYRNCLEDLLHFRSSSSQEIGQLPEPDFNQPISCADLWCLMGLGVYREAANVEEQAFKTANSFFSGDAQGIIDSSIEANIKRDIYLKMAPSKLINHRGEPIPPAVEPDTSLIPVIVGGYMIRKILSNDIRSQQLNQLAEHSGFQIQKYNFNSDLTPDERQDVVRRELQHQFAQGKRYETFSFAMTLPYIQGLFLYALAISFPFFALMILLPGQAGAFFTWMALWAWVKSWDLGWAAVMVIDNLLWNILPQNSYYDPLRDPNHGPISSFEAAFQGDPAYSLGSYYMLLGIMVSAVPLVTAQFVMGGKRAMAGVMINGMKGLGEALGGSLADFVAHDQIWKIDYLREADRINYVRARLDEDASIYAAATREKIEKADREGSGWKIGGWILGGLGVIGAGVATFLTGGLAAPLLVVSIGAMGAGYAVSSRGMDMQRIASMSKAQFIKGNAGQHYYNSAKTDRSFALDAIRSGLSSRGEFWNLVDAPVNINKQFDELTKQLDTLMAKQRGAAIVGGVLSFVPGARVVNAIGTAAQNEDSDV